MNSARRFSSFGRLRFETATMLIFCFAYLPIFGFTQSRAADSQEGKKIYEKNCAECHGSKGRGDGPKARKMGFKPRDLSLGAFKCRCTASGQLPTDHDLFRTVSQGMPGSAMQGLADVLSADEIRQVISFIKDFSSRFESESPGPCLEVPEPPARSAAFEAEGRQVYRILQCWQCHGSAGRGDGPAAPTLKDDWGEPIKPYNFTVLKKFKCGNDDRDLYRTLHTGMNGSPMPSYEAAFSFASEQEVDYEGIGRTFGPGARDEVRTYLSRQPGGAEIRSMSESEKRRLVERRTWSLIQYVRSLLRPARGNSNP